MARSRSRSNVLAGLLMASSLPIYALDDQRRVVFYNSAFARWLGVGMDELIGARCDYHSGPTSTHVEQLAASLCPPPETFRRERRSILLSCHSASGQRSRRHAECIPLGTAESEGVGTLVIVESNESREDERVPGGPPRGHDSESERLHQQLASLRRRLAEAHDMDRLIGDSAAMSRVRAQVQLASQAAVSVLVVGAAGTGREHVARTIHYAGTDGPNASLVPLACPLMDAELLQSTITAFKRRANRDPSDGRFASLLLLDVDRLPADAQHELAGFLSIPGFQLRTLATSSCSLLKLAAEHGFSPNLAYSLSTLTIELPSLAERREDIPLLAQCFLEQANAEGGNQLSGFSEEAFDRLTAYSWPENLDELAQVVRDACRRAEGPTVAAEELGEKLAYASDAALRPRRQPETIRLDSFLSEVEGELVRRALRQSRGNKAKAARMLGVSRARLLRRLEQLGLS